MLRRSFGALRRQLFAHVKPTFVSPKQTVLPYRRANLGCTELQTAAESKSTCWRPPPVNLELFTLPSIKKIYSILDTLYCTLQLLTALRGQPWQSNLKTTSTTTTCTSIIYTVLDTIVIYSIQWRCSLSTSHSYTPIKFYLIVVCPSYSCAGNTMMKRKETNGRRTANQVSRNCFTAHQTTMQPTSRCVRKVETGTIN